MCGRFGLEYGDDFYPHFKITNLLPSLKSNFNISPGQEVPIILNTPEGNIVKTMKWGFVPNWSDDFKIGYKMFNARIETVQEKPSFKNSFNNQRCLVPANLFYEWKEEDGEKIPYCMRIKDCNYFAMAGIYSIWINPNTNVPLYTFTIITSSANDQLQNIHNRMPVTLKPKDESVWLEKGNDPNIFQEISIATLSLKFDITRLDKDFIFHSENKPIH